MFQGAKNLDGAFGALADLIPPHAFVNLTSRLAQAPPAVKNQSLWNVKNLGQVSNTAPTPTPRQARLEIWSYPSLHHQSKNVKLKKWYKMTLT